jgi:endo-1,4-beta-xylanase
MKIWLRKVTITQLLIFLSVCWVNAQETIFERLWTDPQITDSINRDIEQYRKGDAVIEIIDKKGNHISNALVEVHQQTHEFLFGCNLFILGQLKTPELNSRYEAAFSNLFNFATVPFYWGDLEPQQGHPRFEVGSEPVWRRPPPDLLLKWCEDHNITPKGHALMYAKNMFMPKWTEQNNPQKFLEQGEKHIAEIAKRYGDKFPVWDVANEEMPRMHNLNEWHKVPDNYLSWCFKEADNLFPKNVRLLYNDGTVQVHNAPAEYMAIFRKLKEDGARVDGMGIQFHMYDLPATLEGKLFPPKQLFSVYKQLEESGLPLYITEITIAGNGENGDELQAKIVGNLYRLWFSTPNMAGITWWNLGDGTAFGKENEAKGGLLDEEMNSKPAYKVLDRLINHEWKTNLNTSSGSGGSVSFRGFYGRYKITVIHKGKSIEREINLTKTGNNKFVIQL